MKNIYDFITDITGYKNEVPDSYARANFLPCSIMSKNNVSMCSDCPFDEIELQCCIPGMNQIPRECWWRNIDI